MFNSRAATAVLVVALLILVVYAHDTLLLVFGGALIALVLRAAAQRVAGALRIQPIWGVWLTVIAGAAIAAAALGFLGSAVAVQIDALRSTLPVAFAHAIEEMRSTAAGTWITNNLPNLSAMAPDTAHLLTRATGLVSGAIGAVVAFLIVIFVGIAGAVEPALYTNGFVQLFPANYRERIRGTLLEIGVTLRTWLLARLLMMCATALLVTVGLTILRIPLAGALGLLAGALAFVPNIGAFVAAAPAVVLAFVASPQSALAVAAMYVAVHIVDDFIVAPVVERQVVKLPPILTLVAQIVLGIAAGAVGVMLAAPIVAMLLVVVRRLWIEDVADLPLTAGTAAIAAEPSLHEGR